MIASLPITRATRHDGSGTSYALRQLLAQINPTHATDWKPYPNPDRSVTITREGGKFGIEVEGETSYASHAVFAMPMQNIKTFKVLRSDGAEQFHLEKGEGGKPILKHTIRGGRDGSHVYNIREMILANCPVVAPDVVVSEPGAADTGG